MARSVVGWLLVAVALLGTAEGVDDPVCTDTGEPWTTLTRVEGDVLVDGQPEHVRFAGLYDWLTWIVKAQDEGKAVTWPPSLSAVDFNGAAADSGVMVAIPLHQIEINTFSTFDLSDESSSPASGPWIVSTDDFIDGTYWPRYLVFSDLQAAGAAAAIYHGELYHWDTGLVKVMDAVRMMNTPSGGGQNFNFEILPEAGEDPPAPVIIPGGDQDLR